VRHQITTQDPIELLDSIKGREVKWNLRYTRDGEVLQRLLNSDLGPELSLSRKLKTDGGFGINTRSAVVRLQGKLGMEPNGVFDSETATKLRDALTKRAQRNGALDHVAPLDQLRPNPVTPVQYRTLLQDAAPLVLEPGHGGADPGAVYGNRRESEVTKRIGEHLQEALLSRGWPRDRLLSLPKHLQDDSQSYREARSAFAERANATHISLHIDSVQGVKNARAENHYERLKVIYGGHEKKRERSHTVGRDFTEAASVDNAALRSELRSENDLGREGLYMFAGKKNSAILFEISEISNPRLDNDQYLKRIAENIADGLVSAEVNRAARGLNPRLLLARAGRPNPTD